MNRQMSRCHVLLVVVRDSDSVGDWSCNREAVWTDVNVYTYMLSCTYVSVTFVPVSHEKESVFMIAS